MAIPCFSWGWNSSLLWTRQYLETMSWLMWFLVHLLINRVLVRLTTMQVLIKKEMWSPGLWNSQLSFQCKRCDFSFISVLFQWIQLSWMNRSMGCPQQAESVVNALVYSVPVKNQVSEVNKFSWVLFTCRNTAALQDETSEAFPSLCRAVL